MTSTVTADRTTVTAPARLPAAGVVAGPLFLAVAMAQVALVPGFDLDRHPLSLLALGPWGLVQIADFVVTGVLLSLAGTGLGRVMPSGPGSVWGPRLVAGFGFGMILSGVFVADPSDGVPGGHGGRARGPQLARRTARGGLRRGHGVLDRGLPRVCPLVHRAG